MIPRLYSYLQGLMMEHFCRNILLYLHSYLLSQPKSLYNSVSHDLSILLVKIARLAKEDVFYSQQMDKAKIILNNIRMLPVLLMHRFVCPFLKVSAV